VRLLSESNRWGMILIIAFLDRKETQEDSRNGAWYRQPSSVKNAENGTLPTPMDEFE
jgi:hypothetical protein